MDSTQLRDVQLLGRVAAGDAKAFGDLFDRHAPVVLGVLVRMLGRREEAEDVMQEAFFQAWHQAAAYRPERASPRGWLLMLARSRAIDRLRSSGARSRRETATALAVEAPPVGTRRLETAEARDRVSAALAELPGEQRRCIELAYWEGLSHTEIAERLSQPLGTVKSRIALGMRKLRNALESTG